MRTTLDIDDPVLRDLKSLQKKQGKTLGRLVSDLLAQSLHRLKASPNASRRTPWVAKAMRARVDLADHEALYRVMEEKGG